MRRISTRFTTWTLLFFLSCGPTVTPMAWSLAPSSGFAKNASERDKDILFVPNHATPLDVYFAQISLQKVDAQFSPLSSGYSETEVYANVTSYGGGRLPRNRYKMVFYDGEPLFLQMADRVVIPLRPLNIPFQAQGVRMADIEKEMAKTIVLITHYFGYGLDAWHEEVVPLHDFAPRWLSENSCTALGLKSLVVLQGIFSPLEDMGEDTRYEHVVDNTILEGLHVLLNKVRLGQRLLVYSPGSGAEAIRMALQGVYVTALCTNEEERRNVEVNAWLNGVDPEHLEVVMSIQKEHQMFDFAYFNAPRPVYPDNFHEGTDMFKYFELDSRKFDKGGEKSTAFFQLAEEWITEDGSVLCIAPDVSSYHNLIYEAGFNVEEKIVEKMMEQQPGGDLLVYVLFKDDRRILDHVNLNTLLATSVDSQETPFLQQVAKNRLRDAYSRFSETGIDHDVSAGADDYFGVLRANIPADLFCYILIDLLTRTQQYGVTLEEVKGRLDRSILALEQELARSTMLRDPFTSQGLRDIVNQAIELSGKRSGVFVKTEVLVSMLRRNPPRQLMREWAVEDLNELLKKMDPRAIFSLGRYMEDEEWTKRNYALYERLKPEDFEERPVYVVVFDTLSSKGMEYFQGKLPFSNDKIAGTLTGLPVPPSPENRVPRLRALSRALHYLHELDFYSTIVRTHLPGAWDGEQFIGEILSNVLSEEFGIDQFFEPHAMVEVLFMVQAMKDLEKLDTVGFPPEWKEMPFSLGVFDGNEIKWASVIDRITTLSKGTDSNLHARRFLRLAPLIYFYGELTNPFRLLVTTYGNPEFIALALEHGWSLTQLRSDRDIASVTSDYVEKVHAYLEGHRAGGVMIERIEPEKRVVSVSA